MSTVTRTITAQTNADLAPIAKVIGGMRADIWHRYGGVASTRGKLIGFKSDCAKIYGRLHVDGTIRNETTIDTLNDIKAFREAAKRLTRQAINRRCGTDKAEAKRLYTLLKRDQWIDDPFLHRQMRKHFRHGQVRNRNQFVVRSDRHTEQVVDGNLVINIRIAKKYGADIQLVCNTTGDGVDLTGKNLRIILRDGFVEVHYAFDKGPGREAGTEVIGVDKGYTEALADSDGHFHGRNFGTILKEYTEKVHGTGKMRGKLKALERKHRAAGRTAKADRIARHNLGTKKIDRRRERAQKRLRTEAFRAAHAVVDKASVVGAEDLTSVISRKKSWGRGFNRRMGFWAKGALAEALQSVTEQRSASLVLVNAAYSSQANSRTGCLEGNRQGDRFITPDGEVLHSDVNAARNIRDRIDDPDITRFMPFTDVRKVLLRRSSGGVLPVKRLELGVNAARQPSADTILCSEMSRF